MSLELSQELLRLFRGREDVIAYSVDGSSFRPKQLDEDFTAERLNKGHFSDPNRCLGFYLLRPDNTVCSTCLDFDNHDGKNPTAFQEARAAYLWLQDTGLEPLVEISQSGTGIHIWLSYAEPQPSVLVYRFWQTIIKRAQIPAGTEVYPRQASLDGLKLGNLVRFPLYRQSHFVEIGDLDENGNVQFTDLDQLQTLQNYRQTTTDEFRNVCSYLGVSEDQEYDDQYEVVEDTELPARVKSLLLENPSGLLAKRWAGDVTGMNDPSNSAILMTIATELVRSFVPTDEIESTLRYWGRSHGYEKVERDDFVRRTARKAYDMLVKRAEVKSLTGHTLAELAHEYADIVLRNEEQIVPTGIQRCDESFQGIAIGEYGLIAARPSMGKTALALHWMSVASQLHHPCLFISLEMSAKESSRRVLLNVGGIEPTQWKSEAGNKLLHQSIERHYKGRAPIYFVEGAYSLDRIEELCQQYVQDHGVKFICLDYIGLVNAGYKAEYDNITQTSMRLRKIASSNEVAIIALAQLRREQNDDDDDMPQMSSLKGSGQLEADADVILVCRWPWKKDECAPKHHYEIYCLKARNRNIKHQLCVATFDSDKQFFM